VSTRKLYCSFCGKKQEEVVRLLGAAKLGAFICNECVEGAVHQLAADKVAPFWRMALAERMDNVVPLSRRLSK
jgi:ATP-dependent protease Clp ATPase subunit